MYIQVLAVIGFVAVASAADLNIGVEGGRIIFDKNVTASPAIWRQIQNLTVNASNSDEVISRVVVIDNRPEKDGEATVVEGGEGQKNVTIELKGPAVFRGFDFSIQVFANEENVNARVPSNPISTGLAGQNPQVPYVKDINVNDHSKQVPKKEGNDITLGAPKPTVTSTTEAAKGSNENQEKINNPAVIGQEQTRQNRDTKGQTTEQTPIPTPVHVTSEAVEPTKDIKVDENTNKTAQEQHDEDWKKSIDSIFANNSTQQTEDSKPVGPVQPVIPQEEIDSVLQEDDERQVRQTEKDSIVPDLHKELKDDEKLTTPKSDFSTTEKSIGQEKNGLVVVPVFTGTSSTAYASKLTTESPKLPENVKTTAELKNLKGHHFEHQHPAVPLPYVNQ